jgi:hypothetical protein
MPNVSSHEEFPMHIQPRSFFCSGLTMTLLLLAETAALAQGQPYGGAGAPPPAYAPPPGYSAQPQPGYYPPPAYYPPPGYSRRPIYVTPPGYHQHDGFYMRLYTGIGYLTASDTYQGSKETFSGTGVTFGASFGGVIAPNLVLYGEFLGTVVTDPTYEYGGVSGTASGSDLTLFGIGPGIAYYFDPLNLYVSGTLTFSQVTASDNQSSGSNNSTDLTDMGVGTNLMVGKEWWVSSDWGLCVAAQLHIASMKMKDYDARMTAAALSLLFSATYN